MSEAQSPEKLAKIGKSEYKKGDHLSAAHTFEAASEGYQVSGRLLDSAELANNASVAFLQAGEESDALRIVEGTPEVFEQAGDLRRQGMALGNYASALEALDRLDEASETYRHSAEILEQAGEDQLRANVMHSLSTLQLRTGRQLQALASMQAGIEGVKKPSPRQRMLKRLLNIPFDMINKKNKK